MFIRGLGHYWHYSRLFALVVLFATIRYSGFPDTVLILGMQTTRKRKPTPKNRTILNAYKRKSASMNLANLSRTQAKSKESYETLGQNN